MRRGGGSSSTGPRQMPASSCQGPPHCSCPPPPRTRGACRSLLAPFVPGASPPRQAEPKPDCAPPVCNTETPPQSVAEMPPCERSSHGTRVPAGKVGCGHRDTRPFPPLSVKPLRLEEAVSPPHPSSAGQAGTGNVGGGRRTPAGSSRGSGAPGREVLIIPRYHFLSFLPSQPSKCSVHSSTSGSLASLTPEHLQPPLDIFRGRGTADRLPLPLAPRTSISRTPDPNTGGQAGLKTRSGSRWRGPV